LLTCALRVRVEPGRKRVGEKLAMRVLETVYRHRWSGTGPVRALRFLYFKRSFVIVRKALNDPDNQVREAALVAIGGLHFPHAFNPLARIYRESNDPNVRSYALQSIGKIQTVEAGEFLVMVLRQESGNLREAARVALAQMDNADVLPILRQHHEIETNPQVRDTLGELLRRQ